MLEIYLGLFIGKIIIAILRISNRTATALPGLVIEKLFPNFLSLAREKISTVIVITGTNGKTSTQNLLSDILINMYGKKVIVNAQGANLGRGLISQILKDFKLFSKNSFEYAIFEVEEATLPKIVAAIKPNYFIITNFFRDQLDAYGEIERTKNHVRNAIVKFPKAEVIANSDDPQVCSMLTGLPNNINYLSLEDYQEYLQYEPGDKEAKRNLGNILVLPKLTINADLSSTFIINNSPFKLNLPGFHNYYTFAYCYTFLKKIDLDLDSKLTRLATIVEAAKPVFGRGEIIRLKNNQEVQIFLIKNPVGFNLIMDLLTKLNYEFNLAILINDNLADGKDVSWLWDSNLDKISNLKLKDIMVSGKRAADMLLRLKYVTPAITSSIDSLSYTQLVSKYSMPMVSNANHSKLIILATYTAMNQIRSLLLPLKM